MNKFKKKNSTANTTPPFICELLVLQNIFMNKFVTNIKYEWKKIRWKSTKNQMNSWKMIAALQKQKIATINHTQNNG